MHRLAQRVHVIEKSKIEESLAILERHPEVISLGAGEPDFPAPKNVVEFANKMLKKFIILIGISLGLGILTKNTGLTTHQAMAISIFSASILGTLFFWDFRLGFAFIGISILYTSQLHSQPGTFGRLHHMFRSNY